MFRKPRQTQKQNHRFSLVFAKKTPSVRRFRRLRLLIVGCGDVGLRVAARFSPHAIALTALTSQAERVALLRKQGVRPIVGNLDLSASLARLRGLAPYVLHLAPPAAARSSATHDTRSRHLQKALSPRGQSAGLVRMVYGSTSGVYGDCAGQWVTEARALRPQTARAQRRVDAERIWRENTAFRAVVLRIPGIYGSGRSGGGLERIKAGTPILRAEEDVYTNRIHAEDLARAIQRALFLGRPSRVYHIAEPSLDKMGDYLEKLARLHDLPPPRRISRQEMTERASPMQMSFLGESRRLDTTRMRRELKLRLLHVAV